MNQRGVVISLLSSLTFAIFTFVAAALDPLSGLQIWGWRLLLTIPGILIAMLIVKRFYWFTDEYRRIKNNPRILLVYLFTGPMLGAQMWLFGWAPQNGYTLEVSLGYFLLPLVMVLVGRFLFNEQMTFLAWVSTVVASTAVTYEFIRTGVVGWVVVLIAVGYPAYFVVRRLTKTDGVGALTWELVFALPFAAYYAFAEGGLIHAISSLRTTSLLLLLGALSIVGLITYVLAAKLLPYVIFGLLSYIEPVLVTIAALMLGERIAPEQFPTYMGIWLAVAIMALDAVFAVIAKRRHGISPVRPWRRRRAAKRTVKAELNSISV
ncbi:EamA family transporter RarD [Gleimia sp. 6138-11-ORH1]|uniref:EamA family transporter RarD n=1 Tax=Gleimia sp. 6138-11-ORH1 TaxID=2973937 RepID=UPI00216A912E|nr:EamA family transporter RarD [Gleimia sp. 6138-11-ORH1]MCS4484339.1 EamA family transporter RarD [Gleimia sp. 6138-11-ORH1]